MEPAHIAIQAGGDDKPLSLKVNGNEIGPHTIGFVIQANADQAWVSVDILPGKLEFIGNCSLEHMAGSQAAKKIMSLDPKTIQDDILGSLGMGDNIGDAIARWLKKEFGTDERTDPPGLPEAVQ